MSSAFEVPTVLSFLRFFFFFNDTATTEIYTLSLHDALPICPLPGPASALRAPFGEGAPSARCQRRDPDRKSTRLNSSHGYISYAVFCLKKKKKHRPPAPDSGRARPRCATRPLPARTETRDAS